MLSCLNCVSCYKNNYLELVLIAALSAFFGISCFSMNANAQLIPTGNQSAATVVTTTATTAPITPTTSAVPVASSAGMIDLPPVPDVAINQDKLSGYLNHVDEVTKIEKKQNALKDLIPWRGNVGDPKDPNFQALLKQQFPMSPEQIKVFRDTLNIYEQALQAQSRNPTPSMSTRSVDLDPGSSPPPVRISTGYVSTLIFLDETGAPWPIKAYDIGNASAFNVYWDKESNFMMLQGLVPYANTNIVVLLHNLETPVILNLINDQQKVDYRLDLRIPGLGPKATTPMIRSNIPSTDNVLIGLIDGIPPERAKPLQVNGGVASAWIIDDSELLIRTRLTILSPSYTSSMRSADGMKVYRMPKTPVIMASKDGNTYQLAIDGY